MTSDDLRDQIAALEAIDPRTADIDQLRKAFEALADRYACRVRMIETPYAYRARKHEQRTPFQHLSKLWYPPPHAIKTFGRVNRIGQPMFYISASHQTATLEMRPEIGDVITLLSLQRISASKPLRVMEIGVAEKELQHGLPRSIPLLEDTHYGRHFLNAMFGVERHAELRAYLAREFTRIVARGNEHEFKKTIAIGEFLMSSQHIDGLQYPSLAGDTSQWQGGANLVLKPNSADVLFRALECWMIEVEGKSAAPNAGFAVRCIGKAKRIDEDGRIQW